MMGFKGRHRRWLAAQLALASRGGGRGQHAGEPVVLRVGAAVAAEQLLGGSPADPPGVACAHLTSSSVVSRARVTPRYLSCAISPASITP